jgi:hypothetical protein
MIATPCKPKHQYTHDDPAHPYKTTEEYKAYKRALYKANPEYYCQKSREWHEKNPNYIKEYCRKKYLSGKHHDSNANRTKEMVRAHNITQDSPMAKFCELCPPDELLLAKMRHHPDYNYPAIYVSVCRSCHTAIHRALKKQEQIMEVCVS